MLGILTGILTGVGFCTVGLLGVTTRVGRGTEYVLTIVLLLHMVISFLVIENLIDNISRAFYHQFAVIHLLNVAIQ